MNITFSLELSNSKSSTEDHRVLIRCTKNRRHKRIATGITIKEKFWDKKLHSIKKNHPLCAEYNMLLTEKIKKLTKCHTKALEMLDEVFIEDVLNVYYSDISTDFFEFAHLTKMAEIQSRKKLGTYRRYESVLRSSRPLIQLRKSKVIIISKQF